MKETEVRMAINRLMCGNTAHSKDANYIKLAIEALEKQIPKSWIRNEYFDFEYTWECPSCKEEYVLIEGGVLENGYSYCPNCGQKLYWEEVEE